MFREWMVDEKRWRAYASVQLLKIQERQGLVAFTISASLLIYLVAYYSHELALGMSVVLLGLTGRIFAKSEGDVKAVQEVLVSMDQESHD